MGFQKMCGCVWEKKGLTCYQSDTKCIRQRVTLVNVGSFTEIWDDSINSGHR